MGVLGVPISEGGREAIFFTKCKCSGWLAPGSFESSCTPRQSQYGRRESHSLVLPGASLDGGQAGSPASSDIGGRSHRQSQSQSRVPVPLPGASPNSLQSHSRVPVPTPISPSPSPNGGQAGSSDIGGRSVPIPGASPNGGQSWQLRYRRRFAGSPTPLYFRVAGFSPECEIPVLPSQSLSPG